MLYSPCSKLGLKILTSKQMIDLLDKLYIRLVYGTKYESMIAVEYIKPARDILKEYWNLHE